MLSTALFHITAPGCLVGCDREVGAAARLAARVVDNSCPGALLKPGGASTVSTVDEGPHFMPQGKLIPQLRHKVNVRLACGTVAQELFDFGNDLA